MTNNQFLLIMAATFVGATVGGVAYHALTCQTCKQAKGEQAIEQVAKASADMNGATSSPRVLP